MPHPGNPRLEEIGNFLPRTRFVILHHALPSDSDRPSHWDLLLQPPSLPGAPSQDNQSSLFAFELIVSPCTWFSPSVQETDFATAMVHRLPNHRSLYLDYEGPVSGNRGNVIKLATGTLEWLELSDTLLRFRMRLETMQVAEFQGVTPMELLIEMTHIEPESRAAWHLKRWKPLQC